MSLNIKKIRERIKIGPDKSEGSVSDLPLDHRLTFNPSADESWSFEEGGCGYVLYNGYDVDELINEFFNDVNYLNCLSTSLDHYRKHVWSVNGRSNDKYNGKVNALLEKIVNRLGNIYYGLVGGIKFEYNNGDLWINNINLRVVLNLYKIRPTRQARSYLIGLRDKLAMILSSDNNSTRYESINDEAEGLFNEISCAIDQIPINDDYISLPASRSC